MHLGGERLVRRLDLHRALVGRRVEVAAGAVGEPGRVRRRHADQPILQRRRQRVERRLLARPQRVATERRHVVRVEQRVRRRLRQVRQVGVPGVGEVQLVVRFLDHPDHVRPAFDRLDVRRDVAPAELIGRPLELIEVEELIGQGHHEMLVEQRGQLGRLVRRLRPRQVDTAHDRPARPGDPFDLPTHRVDRTPRRAAVVRRTPLVLSVLSPGIRDRRRDDRQRTVVRRQVGRYAARKRSTVRSTKPASIGTEPESCAKNSGPDQDRGRLGIAGRGGEDPLGNTLGDQPCRAPRPDVHPGASRGRRSRPRASSTTSAPGAPGPIRGR